MHTVCPLIHQNCDRSVRSSIGYMPYHFFHDEWINNHKAYDFPCVEPGLLPQNRAVIEYPEHHQPRPAQSFLKRTFQFGKALCALDCLPELDDIGMPNGRFERRHHRLKRLGGRRAEPSISTFLI